ncbi:MAG: hypothetical protein N2439_17875, partial [Anaerolineae bacterium]|nr:hypothetical protein [Anaerolineae bacterium]
MKPPRHETIGLGLLCGGLLALVLLLPGEPGAAGPAPLRVAFGAAAVAVVLALVAGGIALLFAERLGWQVRWPAIAAAEVGFLVLVAAAHLSEREPWPAARAGRGGGVVGWALSQLLLAVFPPEAAYALLILAGVLALVAFWRGLPPSWTARPNAWLGRAIVLLKPGRASRPTTRPAPSAGQAPARVQMAKLTAVWRAAGQRLAAGWAAWRSGIGRVLAPFLPGRPDEIAATAGRPPAAPRRPAPVRSAARPPA